MKKKIFLIIFFISFISSVYGRDRIRIVGSSTVFPFSSLVAERFGKTTNYKTPIVEALGTGGGFKLFCSGLGDRFPDINNASRKIKKSEKKKCKQKSITPIEVIIGYDGIVIAGSKKSLSLNLTKKDIFMALAKQIPIDGKLVDNPYKKWSDINPSYPNIKIELLGPPTTSGTRDAFMDLAMGEGGKLFPSLNNLLNLKSKEKIKFAMQNLNISPAIYDFLEEVKNKKIVGKDIFTLVAYSIREDGAFIDMSENDNLIIQKLFSNNKIYGIFGYSFLEENISSLKPIKIDGYMPTFENISSGEYSISRSLYIYVKKEHLNYISGLRSFVKTYLNEDTISDEGYLVDKGLIPLNYDLRKQVRKIVSNSLAN